MISAHEAPDDFPDALPKVPPNEDEICQLLEVWSNVTSINSLRAEIWDGVQRCVYMLWTTDDRRQFRVIWDEQSETFQTRERTRPI